MKTEDISLPMNICIITPLKIDLRQRHMSNFIETSWRFVLGEMSMNYISREATKISLSCILQSTVTVLNHSACVVFLLV